LALTLCFLISSFASAPANELPGEELTDYQIHRTRVSRGDIGAEAVGAAANEGGPRADRSWFEKAMDTWNAPRLEVQMGEDDAIVPFGMGGIFVPRYTEMNNEPDIEIFDMEDNRVASSETGRTVILEPGEYRLTLGSGATRQRIVKNIRIEEGRVFPVIPDWAGLIIDVVDEQNMILRGEYELVRIDEFDPYGRGYGASVELGETVRAWILTPGVYKIFSVGDGYNTMTNFVTVRLMPGELTNFLLIQDPDDFRIRGGGTIHLTPTTRLTSNWRAGMSVGANLQFNTETDHQADMGVNTFTMGLLLDSWLLYRNRPVEWSTRLRLEEGINIIDNSFENMINSPDRLLLSSIFIWRILNWFGPYARAEFNTKFFDTVIRRNNELAFRFVDGDYYYDETAGADSAQTFMVEPALSPLTFELGAGVSADFTMQRFFELRSRVGFGSSYSRYDNRHRVIENNKVRYSSPDSLAQKDTVSRSIMLYPESKVNIFEVGPQVSVSGMIRIGAYATAEGEVKVFAPVIPEHRLTKPDYELNGTFSWRLSRILNLDYTYRQILRQPAELDVPFHTSSHGIWLRLHFATR
jgi:hypothetical protein